jgi:hypothetical protein
LTRKRWHPLQKYGDCGLGKRVGLVLNIQMIVGQPSGSVLKYLEIPGLEFG